MKTDNNRIALVNPPHLKGVNRHPLFPPLSLAYLAAILERNNYEVQVMDCPVLNINHDQLKKDLSVFNPALIGITSMTPTTPSVLRSARVAKEACPGSKVALGGPHATFMDKEILLEEKTADIIVRGEGEETLIEIVDQLPHLHKLDEVKGITFKKNGDEIIQTPNRPFIQNLDELPRPAYKYFPIDKYRIQGRKIFPIMSSRGCPFQCTFCVASQMFGTRFRARSPKNVVDELEWLRDDYGAEGISFHDDTLTFDKKRIIEICDEIIKRNIELPWGCGTRADRVSKEILAKMREANCNEICFGVESGCQKIRDCLNKRISTEQCKKAIKWAKDEGIFVTMSVILGYPGETEETLEQTFNFVHNVKPDDVWLCLPTPYPGTELRSLVESKGWEMEEDWTLYNTMHPIFEDPNLPAEEISRRRKTFYDKFYSPQYILRQVVKGFLRGNLYSKTMAQTALHYIMWRIKPW